MAPVTPEDHLVHALSRLLAVGGDGGQGQGLQHLVGVVRGSRLVAGGVDAPVRVGQLSGGDAGIAVGLGLGGQGTPFRFGPAQSTTTSLRSSCRWSVRGRWSGPLDPTGTAGRAPRRSRPLWWRSGARIKLGRASCAPDETHVTLGRLTDWGRHQVLARRRPPATRTGPGGADDRPAVPRAPRRPRTPGNTERTSFVAQQARSRARSRRSTARTGAAVVAVANQKGGVAKTTTVASLGAAFAEQGKRVLLVDLDAQACLTFSLGVDPDEVGTSINEVLLGKVEAADGRHRLRGRGGPAAERDRAGRRRGAAAAPPGPRVRPALRPGAAAWTGTTSCCWTARRRWGCSPSTR